LIKGRFVLPFILNSVFKAEEFSQKILHKILLNMGRPTTKPKKLKDGFYIEIRNRNSSNGIKIRRDNEELMLRAVKTYERSKDIVVLGKYINGKMVSNYQ
jgi:hypothetical protein